MILTLIVAILAGATPQKSKASPPNRESFEFREWRTGTTYVPGDPRFARCAPIPAGNACVFTDNRIGGVEARQIGAAFGRDGLFALEAKFPRGCYGLEGVSDSSVTG